MALHSSAMLYYIVLLTLVNRPHGKQATRQTQLIVWQVFFLCKSACCQYILSCAVACCFGVVMCLVITVIVVLSPGCRGIIVCCLLLLSWCVHGCHGVIVCYLLVVKVYSCPLIVIVIIVFCHLVVMVIIVCCLLVVVHGILCVLHGCHCNNCVLQELSVVHALRVMV